MTREMNAHVGQQVQPVYAGNAYCGINAPVCPTECPQRRLIGGHSAPGSNTVTIQTQVPFVARGWGVNSATAPFIRFTGIINGVCNLILGGDVNGEAGLPCGGCGSVVDGYPILPGQFMTFTYTLRDPAGAPKIADIWVCGELLCP